VDDVAVYCTNCGHRNAEGANFCSSCGALLSGASSDATVTLHPVDAQGESGDEEFAVSLPEGSAGTAVLVVKRGPNAGARFVLDERVTKVGRHPESDIFLDDITVSRRHAEFHLDAGAFSIRDVGSLNGTYVNQKRIEQVALRSGDEVQIGKFKLVYLAATDE
jgi:pSer/pThr/pTyr-binding forkhead associated (FHA) protein